MGPSNKIFAPLLLPVNTYNVSRTVYIEEDKSGDQQSRKTAPLSPYLG